MNFQVTVFIDAAGNQVPASQTDQAGRRGAKKLTRRTYRGRIVMSAGTWYPSQMAYRPFMRALLAAHAAAVSAEAATDALAARA